MTRNEHDGPPAADAERLDALEQRFARLEQEHASLLVKFFAPPVPDRLTELQETLALTTAALDARIVEVLHSASAAAGAIAQCEVQDLRTLLADIVGLLCEAGRTGRIPGDRVTLLRVRAGQLGVLPAAEERHEAQ